MGRSIHTMGVFGSTRESFFNALKNSGVTHFVDIRRRRGVRGSDYSYANSKQLQSSLMALNIEYRHNLELAPTAETRKSQASADSISGQKKRSREFLTEEFCKLYSEETLINFSPIAFLSSFPENSVIVLFCVEKNAAACHRSLVANAITHASGIGWRDIPTEVET